MKYVNKTFDEYIVECEINRQQSVKYTSQQSDALPRALVELWLNAKMAETELSEAIWAISC